jgi:exodeoxyribonuclease V gamma subunit
VIIMFSGNDERTNAPRPPAVPVGELLDTIDRTARTDGGAARERVIVRHPLQAFDPRNFLAGELVPGRPWGFDPSSLDGALALRGHRTDPPPFLAAPLPALTTPRLALEDLVRFAERPVRAFLRQRLGITVSDSDDEIEDGLPVELDGLDLWQIGQRLLEGMLAGVDPSACIKAEIARGSLPPGKLGIPVIERLWPVVKAIEGHARAFADEEPRAVGINVALPDGRMLIGSVSGVRGRVLLTVSYARLNPRHRLGAWVRLLALSAVDPDQPFEAVTVGRARYGAREADVTVARIGPLGADAETRRDRALAELGALVDLRDRGLREPLPIPSLTAAAYAQAVAVGEDGDAAAGPEWTSRFGFDGEDVDPDHQRAFGGVLSLAELLDAPSRADEHGEGWDATERSRFGRYARRLWGDLLAAETVSDL